MRIRNLYRPRISSGRRLMVMSEFYGVLARSVKHGFSLPEILDALAEKEEEEAKNYRWFFSLCLFLVFLYVSIIFLDALGFHELRRFVAAVTGLLTAFLGSLLGSYFILLTLSGSASEKYLSVLAGRLAREIRLGASLSGAMDKHRRWFQPYEIEMVRVGERSERLEKTLENLSGYMRVRMFRASLGTVLVYPFVLAVFGGSVVMGVLIFIMPQFKKIFNDLGAPFPLWTENLIAVSNWFFHNSVFLLAAIAAILLLVFKYRIYNLILGIPILDRLVRSLAFSQFFFSLGVLLESRIVASDAVNHAARTAAHGRFRRMGWRVANRVEQGASISEALQKERSVPKRLHRLLYLAECNERVPEKCMEMSHWLREQWANRAQRLLSTVEPLCILLMGIIAFLALMGLYLPLFYLPGSIAVESL